jgi:hypothetical protein
MGDGSNRIDPSDMGRECEIEERNMGDGKE